MTLGGQLVGMVGRRLWVEPPRTGRGREGLQSGAQGSSDSGVSSSEINESGPDSRQALYLMQCGAMVLRGLREIDPAPKRPSGRRS
jgi:hypothetical protein